VPERSGFATTTLGATFWGERLGARLASLRLARQPRTPLAEALEGAVHVRGTVRAITDRGRTALGSAHRSSGVSWSASSSADRASV
jgi:hypothetical protein